MELATTTSQVVVRPFHPSDAPAINHLFFDQYGKFYPYTVKPVFPDGHHIWIVAELHGEVVGFARAVRLPGYHNVYELGGLIVRPDMRRHGIARMLTHVRLDLIERKGARITTSEPLAWGPLGSQYNLLGNEFESFGVNAFEYPCISPDIHGTQPASLVLVAKRMASQSDPIWPRFLPPDYEALLHTYVRSEHLTPTTSDPPAEPMPEPIHHPSHRVGEAIGSEYLDVPANWHASFRRIRAAQHEGYLFAGFLPNFGRTANGTVYAFVRLYRPRSAERDFRLIKVLDHVQPLVDFMRREASAS